MLRRLTKLLPPIQPLPRLLLPPPPPPPILLPPPPPQPLLLPPPPPPQRLLLPPPPPPQTLPTTRLRTFLPRSLLSFPTSFQQVRYRKPGQEKDLEFKLMPKILRCKEAGCENVNAFKTAKALSDHYKFEHRNLKIDCTCGQHFKTKADRAQHLKSKECPLEGLSFTKFLSVNKLRIQRGKEEEKKKKEEEEKEKKKKKEEEEEKKKKEEEEKEKKKKKEEEKEKKKKEEEEKEEEEKKKKEEEEKEKKKKEEEEAAQK